MRFNLQIKQEVKQVIIDKKLRRINTNTANNKLNDLMSISKSSLIKKGARDIKNEIFQARKELNIQGPLKADSQRPGRSTLKL